MKGAVAGMAIGAAIKGIMGAMSSEPVSAEAVTSDGVSTQDGGEVELSVDLEKEIDEFKLFNFNEKDSTGNSVVTDGDGGLKVQLGSDNSPNASPSVIEAITLHEGQHLKDYLRYSKNPEIFKGLEEGMILRHSKSATNILERRGYRVGIDYLKMQQQTHAVKARIKIARDHIKNTYAD